MKLNKENVLELVNKDIKEYTREYKIKQSYFNERLHATSLFDGISIVGNYGAIQLIAECIDKKIDVLEEEIATLYEIFKQAYEMQTFLVKNRGKLERLSKLSLIENFSLEEPENKDGVINIRTSFDSSILYNGDGVTSLEDLKKYAWFAIGRLLSKRKEVVIVQEKIYTALSDDDYICDEDEISRDFMRNYSKIDGNRLDELFEDESLIDDKDAILNEVEIYATNQAFNVNKYRGNYSSFILKNFSWDIYLNYCYISEAYIQLLKEKFSEEK